MNTEREARKDAYEYAAAQMFYGEGAGNRRKLIAATVAAKAERDPDYRKAFDREYKRQDMSEHAAKARKDRRRVDTIHAVNKNIKGAATGNYTGVNAAVIVVVVASYYAHKSGFDKKVVAKFREKKHDFQTWRAKKQANKGADKVHNITRIR